MKIILTAIAFCSGLLVTTSAIAEDGAGITHLVCLGAGSANKTTTASVYGSNGWANAVASRESPFDDQVNVTLNWAEPTASRIRLPRKMLPPVHGGSGGWFELKNLKRNEQEITATAGVNFINSPKVRIDRMTGAISINGKAGDYSGNCEPYDPATAVKKF